MRKVIIAALAVGMMAVAAPAFAGEGPAGTSEGHQEPNTPPDTGTHLVEDNQTKCGTADDKTVDTGKGISVNAAGDPSGGGVVICNEGGNDVPIQGRVIAAGGTSGGWVAADGDADNPEQGQGYARADVSSTPSTRCGDTANGDTDSANPASGDGVDCLAIITG